MHGHAVDLPSFQLIRVSSICDKRCEKVAAFVGDVGVVGGVGQLPCSLRMVDEKLHNPSKMRWDLTNGPLSKLLELLDTQVLRGPFSGSCWRFLGHKLQKAPRCLNHSKPHSWWQSPPNHHIAVKISTIQVGWFCLTQTSWTTHIISYLSSISIKGLVTVIHDLWLVIIDYPGTCVCI